MQTLLWLVAAYVAAGVLFAIMEKSVFWAHQGRLQGIAGQWADVRTPIDPVPVRYPVGKVLLMDQISRSGLPCLERARTDLADRLGAAGVVAGFVSVLASYVALLAAAPPSAVYGSLLFVPLFSFGKVGPRGFVKDRRKFGEIYAFLNQHFLGSFTTTSFLAAVGLLVLRLLGVGK